MTKIKAEELEAFIDSGSVAATLELMADIMREKSEHISHSWQDQSLAIAWDKSANDVQKVAAKFRTTGIAGIGL